jgi:VanZ family protein
MGIIFYLSSRPVPESIARLHVADYVLHSIEYAGLSILLFRALNKGLFTPLFPSARPYAVIISTLYGISDELHQWFVPSRSCELSDAIADFTGSLLGVLFIFACRRLWTNPLRET